MTTVFPGGAIGILGGGQLGRMLAMEARRMEYRVGILDPVPNCPASQVANFHIQASLGSVEVALKLAAEVDVVTLETELVPFEVLTEIERIKPVRPSPEVIRIIQDRLLQKEFIGRHGFPQTRYAPVYDDESLKKASSTVGFPGILKSCRGGYDGKGQVRVERDPELADAWNQIGRMRAVLESVVPFRAELSVVLARGASGEVRIYPLAENVHRRHILHTSRAPAPVADTVRKRAEEIAVGIAEALGHWGVMAVEMFLLEDDSVLVNEIAPRTHNSGHYTFGACVTSQFEQHIRAVCGLPLGDPSLMRPAVIVNLLGDLWQNGTPPWAKLLGHPNARLHLYEKQGAVLGRKMGHCLLLDENTDRALRLAEDILQSLGEEKSV